MRPSLIFSGDILSLCYSDYLGLKNLFRLHLTKILRCAQDDIKGKGSHCDPGLDPGEAIQNSRNWIAASLTLLAMTFFMTFPAMAADPGDACTAAQADAWEVSDSDTGILVHCDGTQWRTKELIDESGAATSRIKQVITFGDDTATCDSNTAGTVRYTSGSTCLNYCNGTEWIEIDCETSCTTAISNVDSASMATMPGDTITISNYDAGDLTSPMLFVSIAAENDGSTAPNVLSATFDGTSMTLGVSEHHNTNLDKYAALYYLTGATGTGDIVITMDQDVEALEAVAYMGRCIKQQGPEATETNYISDLEISTDITTLTNNALIVDSFEHGGNQTLGVTGADQNLIYQHSTPTGESTTLGASYKIASSTGSHTMGWTSTGSNHNAHVVLAFETLESSSSSGDGDWTIDGSDIYHETGSVGIGTTSPAALLDVVGGVRVGNDTGSCASNNEGTLRYSSSTEHFEYCDGSNWVRLATSGKVPMDGLIAHWKFDESSGITASDSAGSNDGTLANMDGSTDWVSGKVGNALDFDGTDDIVNVGSPSALDDLTTYSICAWVKWRASTNDPRIYVKDDGTGSNGVRLSLDEYSERLVFRHGRSTQDGTWTSNDDSMPIDDEWRHVCVTYDAGSTANDPSFYINGTSFQVTEMDTPSGSVDSDASYDATIGNRPDLARTLDGQLDDVRVYNRILSADEVSTLYNGGYISDDTDDDWEIDGINIYRETGSVGIGTTSPAALLDVEGGVRVGNDTGSCASNNEGTLRYTGGDPPWEYCNGSAWVPFESAGAGSSAPAGGLASYWPLDEGSGSIAYDTIGGNYGTLTDMDPSTDWISGKISKALDFDGTNDYVMTSASNPYDSYDTGTIALWFKTASDLTVPLANNLTLLMYSTTSTYVSPMSWTINEDTGSLQQGWKPQGGGGKWSSISGTTDVTDGLWHHVAFVADGTNRVKIYLDGVEETTTYWEEDEHSGGEESDFIADIQYISTYDHQMGIGLWFRSSEQKKFFNGRMDDIRIYNRALSASEIEQLYNYTGSIAYPGAGCQAPALCPNVGDVCDDGNSGNNPDPVFAGFMVYEDSSCEPLYTAQSNQSTSSQWKISTGTDDITDESTEDGRVNHDNRGGTLSDFPAFELCEDLTDGGYEDWYLPARTELDLLWRNNAAIGGFTTNSYWSSTESNTSNAWRQDFDVGDQSSHGKTDLYDVRCVRRGNVAPSCPTSGLVAYWKLDESSGYTASDSVGAHAGTLTNMDPATDWVSGRLNNALDFDGVDDYVSISDAPELSGGRDLSWSFWVYVADDSGRQHIIKKDYSSSNKDWGFKYDNQKIHFYYENGADHDGPCNCGVSQTINTNQWHHIAATYENSSRELRLYVNGSPGGIFTLDYSLPDTDAEVMFGKRNYESTDLFQGKLDEVFIYNRVLGAAEISGLYNSGHGCY